MFSFALKNIRSLMKEYKAIFILFFTVFSLVSVSLMYLHSFNSDLLINGNATDYTSRTYILTEHMEPKKAETIIEEIETNISTTGIEGILCYADEQADVDGIPAALAAAYGGVNKKQIALDRGTLELEQSKMQLIMDDIFYQMNAREDFIHDPVAINGETFTLRAVGHIDAAHLDGIITMAGLQKLNLGVREVHIVFEQRLTHEELRILQEIGKDADQWKIPPKYSSTSSRQFLNRFIVIFVLILMATTNILGLYRYLLMRRKKELLIYKIYGIKNGRLFSILFLETVILVTLGFMAGAILFAVITRIVNRWVTVMAGPALFLQTYLMILVCSLFGIVPILHRIRKKSIVSEYMREEGQ